MSQIITRGGVAQPGGAMVYHTGTWRTQRPVHVHAPAPCHHACPAGEDPQAYLALLDEDRPREAWEALVAANPLPGVTGRVCPHFCESACNRREIDEAVGIHLIERHLGDEALSKGWDYPVVTPPADAPQVAVVGAGPAGLAFAYHAIRLGLRVRMFESAPVAGGVCRSAIPTYRLPREVLEGEIERLLALPGLDFQPHTRLGQDIDLQDLLQSHAGVFLGLGNQRPHAWSIDGAVPEDLHNGLELLKEWIDHGAVPEYRSVAVVGGGNTAVDLARVLKRSGAERVHIITHNALPGQGERPGDEMRALPREVTQALEEGIEILPHRGVHRLLLQGERVIGLEMVHMKKLPDANGRLVRIPFEGTETILRVDAVIPAIGEEIDPRGLEALLEGDYALRTDDNGRTAHERVFAGGDMNGRGGTVTEAVGEARHAALAMHAQLTGTARAQAAQGPVADWQHINPAYYDATPRARELVLPIEERTGCAEIEPGISGPQARHEAGRCLSCGMCLSCDNCYTLCPDMAVLKTPEPTTDGSTYVFDYDYCKGCGLCASECPCGFIQMVDDL
ncbi:MAG: FAD-dependent oxidoreductase [Acidihalobacter sp.]|uniref:FAD-dependent oxidoreductase n=1 Tax=Acidihalobacter sp. TaxID=1872108 RepID=UPI00307EBAB6